jgi:cholesterol transport system auxiliary component
MRMHLRLGAAAALLLLGASCSGILPAPPPAPRLFHLTPLALATPATAPVTPQLVVATPAASAALDTARIALARGRNGFDYFANAAWTDRATVMVQALMVQSLENSGRFRVVAEPSAALRADVVLATSLRHFEADYAGGGAPTIRLAMDCQLVHMPDRSVIAARTITASAAAAANDTPAIVATFDTAFHAAMAQLVPWAAASLAPR